MSAHGQSKPNVRSMGGAEETLAVARSLVGVAPNTVAEQLAADMDDDTHDLDSLRKDTKSHAHAHSAKKPSFKDAHKQTPDNADYHQADDEPEGHGVWNTVVYGKKAAKKKAAKKKAAKKTAGGAAAKTT